MLKATMKNQLPRIAQFFDNEVEIIIDNGINQQYYSWFSQIEEAKFREELRYSFDELNNLTLLNNIIILFIIEKNDPQLVVFGYDCKEHVRCFYLDVIAVIPSGKGIGKYIISWFSDILSQLGYDTFHLDTEEFNEMGQPLLKYYLKLGFNVESISPMGNIQLKLNLR